MIYSENLVGLEQYDDLPVEETMDFGLTEVSSAELVQFEKYKKQPIGPWRLRKTKVKGWDVVTDVDIPKHALICEYVGDVFSDRELLTQPELAFHNDSIMDLRVGISADETLAIVPHCHTNIARFINGVKHSKNANLQSLKVRIKGRPAVLLQAKRYIKKHESLTYDYNAGTVTKGFDTSYFKD